MDERTYPVVITPLTADDGGGFAASVPNLPGCMSGGETPEEALRNVGEAIDAWVATALELGHTIPSPSRGTRHALE